MKKKNKKDLKKKILFPISHNREPLGVQPTWRSRFAGLENEVELKELRRRRRPRGKEIDLQME
jgi:hypothetical protein